MMLGDVPCGDAFKRRRHSALISMTNLHSAHHSPHRINYLSFRGGGDKDEENELVVDDNDNDNAVYLDFIASFESELADIRRDVEMETENEMNKLLGLFASVESRGEVEDENEMKSEYYNNVAVDDVGEKSDSSTNDVSLEESLNVVPSSFISEPYYESENESDDDELPENDETIMLTMNNDSKDEPYNEVITDTTTEPVGLSNEVGEYTQIDDVTTSTGSKVSERTKPKTNKRKTKASKKGKTKIKSRQYNDDVIIELSDDLMELQSQSGGFRGFVQSDLGRVLKLFIPTMILAIITTRMQRQMDEADKLAAVEAIAVASEMD
jgi:hypothetical protein